MFCYKRKKVMDKSRKRAFTLIELLVVISIISLLISILLPSLNTARKSAKSVVCLTQLKQISVGYSTFLAENNNVSVRNIWSLVPGEAVNWMLELNPYYGEGKEIPFCPEAKAQRSDGSIFGDAYHRWGTNNNPHAWMGYTTGTYGFNNFLYDINPQRTNQYIIRASGAKREDYGWSNIAKVGRPSLTPAFADGVWIGRWPLHNDYPPQNLKDPYEMYRQRGVNVPVGMKNFAIDRHGKKTTNITYLDGSAENIKIVDLWKRKWSKKFEIQDEFPEKIISGLK
jgi:prepilin-type N-terminal cleavage/methylation domain-containing protein/prepilin-type processing-associated H-X9-DG protein